jgi:hypothetical protein
VAAGKISGPGGAPPNVSSAEPGKPDGPGDAGQTSKAKLEKAEAARGTERPSFADKLAGPAPVAGAARPAASSVARAPSTSGLTSDLAAELGAGKISAKAAIDRVIDRVVDHQVGANAPAALREQVRAALESAVADDPLLSEKIKTLVS